MLSLCILRRVKICSVLSLAVTTNFHKVTQSIPMQYNQHHNPVQIYKLKYTKRSVNPITGRGLNGFEYQELIAITKKYLSFYSLHSILIVPLGLSKTQFNSHIVNQCVKNT